MLHGGSLNFCEHTEYVRTVRLKELRNFCLLWQGLCIQLNCYIKEQRGVKKKIRTVMIFQGGVAIYVASLEVLPPSILNSGSRTEPFIKISWEEFPEIQPTSQTVDRN